MSWEAVKRAIQLGRDHDLSPSQRLLLIAIGDHWNAAKHVAWPSVALLADEVGVTPRQVQRDLKELERVGLLLVYRRGGRLPGGQGRSNLCRLLFMDTVTPGHPKRDRVTRTDEKGDPESEKGDPVSEKGDTRSRKGDTRSPEPRKNHVENQLEKLVPRVHAGEAAALEERSEVVQEATPHNPLEKKDRKRRRPRRPSEPTGSSVLDILTRLSAGFDPGNYDLEERIVYWAQRTPDGQAAMLDGMFKRLALNGRTWSSVEDGLAAAEAADWPADFARPTKALAEAQAHADGSPVRVPGDSSPVPPTGGDRRGRQEG